MKPIDCCIFKLKNSQLRLIIHTKFRFFLDIFQIETTLNLAGPLSGLLGKVKRLKYQTRISAYVNSHTENRTSIINT